MQYHKCSTCRYFTAFYEKAYCRYLRTGLGKCTKLKKILNLDDYCEDWKAKLIPDDNAQKLNVIQEMDEVLNKINSIKSFIENN